MEGLVQTPPAHNVMGDKSSLEQNELSNARTIYAMERV
jgi:hypothetical protein